MLNEIWWNVQKKKLCWHFLEMVGNISICTVQILCVFIRVILNRLYFCMKNTHTFTFLHFIRQWSMSGHNIIITSWSSKYSVRSEIIKWHTSNNNNTSNTCMRTARVHFVHWAQRIHLIIPIQSIVHFYMKWFNDHHHYHVCR